MRKAGWIYLSHSTLKKTIYLQSLKKMNGKTGQNLPWDLQSGWRWLRLRNKKYDIAIELDARVNPVQIRGNLWRKGQHFEIRSSGIKFNGVIQNAQVQNLCLVGTYFKVDTLAKSLSFVPDERFGQGVWVSESNVSKRIRKGLQAWDDLVAGRPPSAAQMYTATKTADGFKISAENLSKNIRRRSSYVTEDPPPRISFYSQTLQLWNFCSRENDRVVYYTQRHRIHRETHSQQTQEYVARRDKTISLPTSSFPTKLNTNSVFALVRSHVVGIWILANISKSFTHFFIKSKKTLCNSLKYLTLGFPPDVHLVR